jgi:hypothetical protein
MTIAASITVIPDVGLYNKSFLLMPLLLLWRYRHEVSSLSGLSLARCLHRVTIACIVVAFVTAGASAIACRTMPSWPVVIGMQILPFMLYLYLPPLVFAALIPLAKKRCFGNNIGASTFVLPLLSY